PEGVLQILVRPGGKAVERHGKAQHPELRHGVPRRVGGLKLAAPAATGNRRGTARLIPSPGPATWTGMLNREDLKMALTFDDVLLVPAASEVLPKQVEVA